MEETAALETEEHRLDEEGGFDDDLHDADEKYDEQQVAGGQAARTPPGTAGEPPPKKSLGKMRRGYPDRSKGQAEACPPQLGQTSTQPEEAKVEAGAPISAQGKNNIKLMKARVLKRMEGGGG